MKSYIIAGVVGIVLIIAAVVIGSSFGPESVEITEDVNAKSAPDFTITDLEGNEISLSENIENGKPTVLYFMASWCPSCAKNWDSLNAVYPDYKDYVSFVSVSVDPTDTNSVLSELSNERNFMFPTSEGNPELARSFNVYAQTTKVAIDSQGNIVYRHDGVLSEEQWRELFDQLN